MNSASVSEARKLGNPTMLQFQFRLTDEEFATSLRLNRAFVPMRWKLYVLVIASMLPSLVTFYLLDAGWSLAWFVIMIGVLGVYAISAYFKKSGSLDNYDQELTLTEACLSSKFSHSQSNLKWGLFDDIEETSHAIRLMRLQRCTYFPNRIFGGQLAECRALISRGRQASLAEVATVDLYRQVYGAESPFPVYEFQYVDEDIELATKSNFQVARDVKIETGKARPLSVWWSVVFISCLVGLLAWLTFDWERQSPLYFAALLGAWLLPLALMLTYIKLVQLRSRRRAQVPQDICKLRLTQSGWAIGNEDGVVLFDWRDVLDIYDSLHFYGFKTINQLLHLIPKRIFPDELANTRFLSQALELHRQAKRQQEVVVATAVETGNPYQAPLPRD